MKILNLFLFTPLLLFSGNTFNKYVLTQTPIVGPYKYHEERDFEFIYSYFTVFPNNNDFMSVYTTDGDECALIGPRTKSYSPKLNLKTLYMDGKRILDYLTYRGLRFVLESRFNVSGELYFKLSREIFPINPTIVYSTSYKDKNYESKEIAIDFSNPKVGKVIMDFSMTENNITNDNFSHLLIDNISFKYDFYTSFTYKEVYLTTSDPYNLFSNFLSQDGFVKIPLNIIDEKGNISFTFKGPLYVDPIDYKMSPKNKYGFHSTKYFFLPISYYDELEDYSFTIKIVEAGGNQDEINIPLVFKSSSRLFDNCISSDFCVVGGIKE